MVLVVRILETEIIIKDNTLMDFLKDLVSMNGVMEVSTRVTSSKVLDVVMECGV